MFFDCEPSQISFFVLRCESTIFVEYLNSLAIPLKTSILHEYWYIEDMKPVSQNYFDGLTSTKSFNFA